MYRRYSQRNGDGLSLTQMKRNRIRNAVMLLLAAVIVALVIIGLPALRYRSEERGLYIQRIQTECSDAIRQTSSLSRNAGADSALILARIRSSIYSIRAINSTYGGQTGRPLIDDDQLLTLQNMVDRYLTYLTTGMDTGEYQTNLQTALGSLQETLTQLR